MKTPLLAIGGFLVSKLFPMSLEPELTEEAPLETILEFDDEILTFGSSSDIMWDFHNNS